MELLNRLAQAARKYLNSRPRKTTDSMKGILQALGELEERVKNSLCHFMNIQAENDVPSSIVYNKNITSIMEDLLTIRAHQEAMISGLLSYWNNAEQIMADSTEETTLIDKEFPTSITPVKSNGYVTLGLSNVIYRFEDMNGIPSLTGTASNPNVPITYGKAYGLYIPGNESGEDGIRPNDNDGSKIVDQKDTFWEVEAVTLQEAMGEGIFSPQAVNTDEISLNVNIKIPFKNPTSINFVTIDPHAFAQSVYYDVTAVNLVVGGKTTNILQKPVTISRKTRITFTKRSVSAIQITLRQNKGYFMKYSLARYAIGNNEKWLDITGPHLISRIDTNLGDVNEAIENEIITAGKWINSIWVPDAPTIEEATLITYVGQDGYFIVESTDSKRKRWAIGIQEIEFGEETYTESSEGVTYSYTMPSEATSMYLLVDEEIPIGTEINYSVSFDNGESWYGILPINRQPILEGTGYYTPQRICINSDLSLERKENSLTGTNGYVNTASSDIRVRVSMSRGTDIVDSPILKSMTPYFDIGEPL